MDYNNYYNINNKAWRSLMDPTSGYKIPRLTEQRDIKIPDNIKNKPLPPSPLKRKMQSPNKGASHLTRGEALPKAQNESQELLAGATKADEMKEKLPAPPPEMGLPPPPPQAKTPIMRKPLPKLPSQAAKNKKMKGILKKNLSSAEAKPKKSVHYNEKVEHRMLFATKTEKGHTLSRAEQTLPLVDESMDSDLVTKDQMSLENANQNLDLEELNIKSWKALEPEKRPRGRSPVGSRTDRNLTEKALTGRGESTIRKALGSPSWQENLGWLDAGLRKRMIEKGITPTKEILFKSMMIISERGHEDLTYDELKELYVSINIDRLYPKQATPEKPGITPQELIDRYDWVEEDLVEWLRTDTPNLTSITKNPDGSFRVNYKKIPIDTIKAYIAGTDLPEK